jgi:hypothetical protein
MTMKQKLRRVVISKSKLTDDDYIDSQKYLMLYTCLGNTIYNLMTGAFITGYAILIGADDRITALLGVMSSITSIIQIFSPLLFEKIRRRKALIVSLFFTYRLMLVSIVFIPLIFQHNNLRIIALMVLYSSALTIMNFVHPAHISWQMSLVSVDMRSLFFSRRDFYSLTLNTIICLIAGKVIDIFQSYNHNYLGFAYVFTFTAVLVLIELIFMTKISEPKLPKTKVPLKLKSVFKLPIKDKLFRKVIVFSAIWNLAAYISYLPQMI